MSSSELRNQVLELIARRTAGSYWNSTPQAEIFAQFEGRVSEVAAALDELRRDELLDVWPVGDEGRSYKLTRGTCPCGYRALSAAEYDYHTKNCSVYRAIREEYEAEHPRISRLSPVEEIQRFGTVEQHLFTVAFLESPVDPEELKSKVRALKPSASPPAVESTLRHLLKITALIEREDGLLMLSPKFCACGREYPNEGDCKRHREDCKVVQRLREEV